MKDWRSSRGLSLLEATIILMVLSTLTAVLAPSITSYVQDGRNVAAKEDVEAIGSAILQALRDTGSRCLRLAGTTECTKANRVDLLTSGGTDPLDSHVADTTVDSDLATNASVNWLPDPQAPTQQDTIDDQLVENDNGTPYALVSFPAAGGPRMKLGWRGPYLNGPISGDPWGRKYQASTIFLAVATDAVDGGGNQAQEGTRETAWARDVIVVSAGGDGFIDTLFGGTEAGGLSAGGDDVIYNLGGTTR